MTAEPRVWAIALHTAWWDALRAWCLPQFGLEMAVCDMALVVSAPSEEHAQAFEATFDDPRLKPPPGGGTFLIHRDGVRVTLELHWPGGASPVRAVKGDHDGQ